MWAQPLIWNVVKYTQRLFKDKTDTDKLLQRNFGHDCLFEQIREKKTMSKPDLLFKKHELVVLVVIVRCHF